MQPFLASKVFVLLVSPLKTWERSLTTAVTRKMTQRICKQYLLKGRTSWFICTSVFSILHAGSIQVPCKIAKSAILDQETWAQIAGIDDFVPMGANGTVSRTALRERGPQGMDRTCAFKTLFNSVKCMEYYFNVWCMHGSSCTCHDSVETNILIDSVECQRRVS